MEPRDNNTYELDSEQDSDISDAKTHEEILAIIEELKEFESSFPDYYLEKAEVEEELIDIEKDVESFTEVEQDTVEFTEVDSDVVEFVEVEEDKLEEFEPIPFEEITEESREIDEIRQARIKGKAATFRLRFDEEGKLVNIDLKKTKSLKKKGESKKRINLKKIIPKRKEKSEETESESTEKKGKLSKLKGGFSKIGKLKKVIPTRKKSEETEESETEE